MRVALMACSSNLSMSHVKKLISCLLSFSLMELEATRDEILFEVHQQKVEEGLEFMEQEVTYTS